MAYLKKNSGWFLILDNWEDLNLQSFFPVHQPEICGDGQFIITTQDVTLKTKQPTCVSKECFVETSILTDDEMIELFYKRYSSSRTMQEEDLSQLTKHIPPYPLDVIMVANTLSDTCESVTEYIEKIMEVRMEVKESIAGTDYTTTRNQMIFMYLDRLLTKNHLFAADLLLLSVLDFHHVKISSLSKQHRSSLIQEINKMSLFEFNDGIMKIHPTFQGIMLRALNNRLAPEAKEEHIQGIWHTVLDFPVSDTVMQTELWVMINHLKSFMNALSQLTISTAVKELLTWKATYKLAEIYLNMANFSEAKTYYDKLLQLPKIEDDALLIKAKNNAASCYWVMDEYERSIELSQEALTYFQEHTPTSLSIVNCYVNIVSAYTYWDEEIKAMEAFEAGIQFLDNNTFSNPDEAVKSRSFLYRRIAQFYFIRAVHYEEVDKAIEYMEKTVKLGKQLKDTSHDNLKYYIRHLGSLTYMLTQRGNFDRANKIMTEIEGHMTNDSDSFDKFMHARTQVEKAHLFMREEKYALAEELFSKYIREYVFLAEGQKVPTMDVLLVENLIRLNKFSEALELISQHETEHKDLSNNISCFARTLMIFHQAVIYFKQKDIEKCESSLLLFLEKIQFFYKQYAEIYSFSEQTKFKAQEGDEITTLFNKSKAAIKLFYDENHPFMTQYSNLGRNTL